MGSSSGRNDAGDIHRGASRHPFRRFRAGSPVRRAFEAGCSRSAAGQALRILELLLERRGEVVTRDELRQVLWPGDTFVDFDGGLNTAVNKLRAALGDSAERPRFVETVGRRGYRLIASVEAVEATPDLTRTRARSPRPRRLRRTSRRCPGSPSSPDRDARRRRAGRRARCACSGRSSARHRPLPASGPWPSCP